MANITTQITLSKNQKIGVIHMQDGKDLTTGEKVAIGAAAAGLAAAFGYALYKSLKKDKPKVYKCWNCKRVVSRNARTCPFCGANFIE